MVRFPPRAPANRGTATKKQAKTLWTSQIIDPKSHAALTPTTVLHLCDKQSLTPSCHFLCQNATCEIYIGTMRVHVWYLCEKFSTSKMIPTQISAYYSSTQKSYWQNCKYHALTKEKLDEIGSTLNIIFGNPSDTVHRRIRRSIQHFHLRGSVTSRMLENNLTSFPFKLYAHLVLGVSGDLTNFKTFQNFVGASIAILNCWVSLGPRLILWLV
jgi:hypothetical protein